MSSIRSNFALYLNSSNLVSGGYNNVYEYRFPTNVTFKNSKLALGKVSMYYSWYNITAALQNNTFSIITPANGTLNITIPDGYYSISTLNGYIQSQLVANNLYLLDASGNYVYYISVSTNSTYYAVEWTFYLVPTALPAGYTNPAGFLFPGVAATTQVVINNNSFADIVGLSAGTYPTITTATTAQLSTYTPQVTPVQSVVLTCDILRNIYYNPASFLYSFTPTGTAYGSLIESSPNEYIYVDIADGSYSSLRIQILDQSLNAVLINDTNVSITLYISTENAYSL